jgi:hypothetical protein
LSRSANSTATASEATRTGGVVASVSADSSVALEGAVLNYQVSTTDEDRAARTHATTTTATHAAVAAVRLKALELRVAHRQATRGANGEGPEKARVQRLKIASIEGRAVELRNRAIGFDRYVGGDDGSRGRPGGVSGVIYNLAEQERRSGRQHDSVRDISFARNALRDHRYHGLLAV